MDLWRQCIAWLIRCRVLPENHRLSWDSTQVCDLAQALRDGVLLCQLLNNIQPMSINLKEVNLRPQMSQFLCLKNIRTFLSTCEQHFGMKKNELFEAFDLFDLRDFAKVINSLSSLSYTSVSRNCGIQPFPVEPCIPDEDIYSGLSEEIDCMEDENDDLYDCVDEDIDDGGEIYEDLMRSEEPPQMQRVTEVDKRSCCLQEISQTEEKYSNTLESIIQHFMRPLQSLLLQEDIESIFINLEELADTHHNLLEDTRHSIYECGAFNLHQVFISYKERLLLYGRYCSQVEAAAKHLDMLSATYSDVRTMLKECAQCANNGRFTLRDLLMVPMQRVLKYHLLLQELMKHTTDHAEKENLRTALDAMRDLAQCVNEVKRDNEIIRQITAFQLSIENLQQPIAHYGRPRIDGELKICSSEKKSKQDRYAFLFDKAILVCKRKSGDNMELKDLIELKICHLTNETDDKNEKDKKWCHTFCLVNARRQPIFDLYFKTKELKKKWLEQFHMAFSNMSPENRTANNHDFIMHTFDGTMSCKACHMLLRGIFFQGYRCTRCSAAAHKECLSRVPSCRKNSESSGMPRKRENKRTPPNMQPKADLVEVFQDYYGCPPPPVGYGYPLALTQGDIVELIRRERDPQWWEGSNVVTGERGWFPCHSVRSFIPRGTSDLKAFPWFAGNIDRNVAKNLLLPCMEGTYLVRQKDGEEFAISIKFRAEVKHIKVTCMKGLFQINEKRAFKGLAELVEYFQQNTLRECFKDLDSTLQFPYKELNENSVQSPSSDFSSAGGNDRYVGWARALYDFSRRDSSELSLRAGDEVKIISKDAAEGWWMGEVYGLVGLFPANYVEENYSDYC
ncbi:proto-oncogene vav-like isoform X2 [Scleropages formosus]|uniref:proto-oncogene vav-like isoform X2 n=1 Tax=Scleropages formosus TaxID=113540 RepID=UPI0010FA71D7|nr:proto-oncogene vav-like isoform X2 [Scleropages formosus]